MVIRPQSFFPRPNVDSMGVLLEKKDSPSYPSLYFPLVRALFASRRKTIKNNLSGFLASRTGKLPEKTAVRDICEAVFKENSLTGGERAEELEPAVFLSLANSVQNMRL
jgi:16S rRNA (adenine1518-N6/adenine1519-N6)-dimethyltransferase